MCAAHKTLVLLIPGFPENEADTTCLPAQQSMVRTINQVYPALQVVIIAFQYPFTTHRYQWYGNTVIPLGGRNRKHPGRLATWWKAWRQLQTLRKENDVIGILSCWCGECALVGKYFGVWRRLPHFIWVLGQDARALNKQVRRIRPKPGTLVAMSDFLAEEFNRNHHVKPQHIAPNGIDTTLFPVAGAAVDIDVIGVGSLIPLKQFDLFVEIIGLLKQRIPDIRAVICGKGPEEERLKTLIKRLGLAENIRLYGEKPHGEVLQLMQRSRVLLHPSSYEGFAGVLLEALYAGAQVVSFCRAMNADIPRWHIAKDKDDMTATTLSLLLQPATDRSPLLPYPMETSARTIIGLFGYTEEMTS